MLARLGTLHLNDNTMSRAQIAEALLRNVLFFFDSTKNLKQGAVISCMQTFLVGSLFSQAWFS
jgi:hypothetical protein